MIASFLVDTEGELDTLAIAEAKAPVVVILLQVKILGALEGEGGCLRRCDAVQREAALVVVILKAAHEVKARALLRQTERHHLSLGAFASGILIIHT